MGAARIQRMAVLFLFAAMMAGLPKGLLAADPWDRTEKALAGTMIVLTTIDYGQTLHIAKHPEDHYETANPLLGKHPSPKSVTIYFAAATAGKLAVAHLLPHKWRKAWLGGWTAVSFGLVAYNSRPGAGIRMEF